MDEKDRMGVQWIWNPHGVIFSKTNLSLIWPVIFNAPFSKRILKAYEQPEIREGFVFSGDDCWYGEFPKTFPLLSPGVQHQLEDNFGKSITGYRIGFYPRCDYTSTGFASRRTVVSRCYGYLHLSCLLGSEDWPLLSVVVDEAVILKESSRLITTDILMGIKNEEGLVEINYMITTINDTEIPMFHADIIRKTTTDGFFSTCIDVRRHRVYSRQIGSATAFAVAQAIVEGRTPTDRCRTYKGWQLLSVGINFPLDQVRTFHFIFTEKTYGQGESADSAPGIEDGGYYTS